MSTPAAIALLLPDKRIRTVYLSSDGQPATTGKTLLEAWNTEERILQLLELGDLLWLGTELGEPHDRENPSIARARHWCTAYRRDHGSNYEMPVDRQAQIFPNLVTFLLQSAWDHTPWNYVYVREGWIIYPTLRYPGIPLTATTLLELVKN